jgi:hypothetical protein
VSAHFERKSERERERQIDREREADREIERIPCPGSKSSSLSLDSAEDSSPSLF